jgi:hypothetical protein
MTMSGRQSRVRSARNLLTCAWGVVACVVALALTVSACAGVGTGLEGEWDGQEGADRSVEVYRGSAHCGKEDVLFLTMVDQSSGERRSFARDPDRDIDDPSVGDLVQDASLPDDAENSHFEHSGFQLWIAADGLTAYLVGEDETEAWPAVDEGVTICG